MVISNSAEAFRIQSNLLAFTGVWPTENPNIIYRIRTIFSWFSAVGFFGMLLTQCIYDIKDIIKLSETLYLLVTYMELILKLSVLSHRRKEFLNIICSLKKPIFVSYPEDLNYYMAKSIKQSVFLAKTYRIVAVTIIIGYAIYPILDNKPLPSPFPYDLGKYTIPVYCFQLIGGSFCMVNVVCYDLTCTSLMGLASAQLDILSKKIIRLKEGAVVEGSGIFHEVDENLSVKLKHCVKHHLAIIK